MAIIEKKAGLVLEGGATRGIFTSGVLDYLMEQELYLPYVIGVSAGACNGIDYVSGQIGRTRNCIIPPDKDSRYIDVRKALKTGSLFDMDLIFDKYPKEIFPFDFEAYQNSKIRCEMAVTNCGSSPSVVPPAACRSPRAWWRSTGSLTWTEDWPIPSRWRGC